LSRGERALRENLVKTPSQPLQDRNLLGPTLGAISRFLLVGETREGVISHPLQRNYTSVRNGGDGRVGKFSSRSLGLDFNTAPHKTQWGNKKKAVEKGGGGCLLGGERISKFPLKRVIRTTSGRKGVTKGTKSTERGGLGKQGFGGGG